MTLHKINLDKDTTKPISDFCKNQGWDLPKMEITYIMPAGDGNMNTVKRALLSNGTSLLLKQAFPFVKKYPMSILLAIIAINLFSIASSLRTEAYLNREKNLCIKYLKHQIDRDTLIKKLRIVKQANPSSICDSVLKS